MLNFLSRMIVALLLLTPLGAAVADEGYHCGSKIIVVGMTQVVFDQDRLVSIQ